MPKRSLVAWAVVLGVAAVHVWRPVSPADGPVFRLWAGYASDVLVPLGAWFVLGLARRLPAFLRDRRMRALAVFGAAAIAETAQGFGVPLLGRTFDPRDYVCYALGTAAAAGIDAALRERHLPGDAASGGIGGSGASG